MGRGGDMSCGESCIKYILFFFNFLFWLIGAAILGIGLWLRFDGRMKGIATLAEQEGQDPYAVVYFIMCLGAIVFLLGFLGCAGACCESKCMLGLYAGLIVLIIILEIVAGILAAVYKNDVEKAVMTAMTNNMVNYGDIAIAEASRNESSKAIDEIQQMFKCCGDTNSDVYDGQIPDSCYEDKVTTNTQFEEGCADAIKEWLKHNMGLIIGVVCGVIGFEILSAVMAGCVLRGIDT